MPEKPPTEWFRQFLAKGLLPKREKPIAKAPPLEPPPGELPLEPGIHTVGTTQYEVVVNKDGSRSIRVLRKLSPRPAEEAAPGMFEPGGAVGEIFRGLGEIARGLGPQPGERAPYPLEAPVEAVKGFFDPLRQRFTGTTFAPPETSAGRIGRLAGAFVPPFTELARPLEGGRAYTPEEVALMAGMFLPLSPGGALRAGGAPLGTLAQAGAYKVGAGARAGVPKVAAGARKLAAEEAGFAKIPATPSSPLNKALNRIKTQEDLDKEIARIRASKIPDNAKQQAVKYLNDNAILEEEVAKVAPQVLPKQAAKPAPGQAPLAEAAAPAPRPAGAETPLQVAQREIQEVIAQNRLTGTERRAKAVLPTEAPLAQQAAAYKAVRPAPPPVSAEGVVPPLPKVAQPQAAGVPPAAGKAPPPKPPPTGKAPLGGKPPPNTTFKNALDMPGQIPGEDPGRVLVRQHEGAMNLFGAETRAWLNQQQKQLQGLPLRRSLMQQARTAESETFITDLAERASGGRERLLARNPELAGYYDSLAKKLAEIEARDAAHSAQMGRELALIPDYFPDLFVQTSPFIQDVKRVLTRKGLPGTREFFEKPRVFRTTKEAIEAGKQFVTYDPALLIALRDIAGFRRIQGDVLFQKARVANLAVQDIRGKVPDGWRQPRGIPAFNPKPIPHTAGEKAPLLTPGYAVPEGLAARLEDYFGTTARSTNPFINGLAWTAGQGKKLKVLASFFQHMDFLRRGTASKIFVGGKPAEVPQMVVETLEAAVRPGKREALLREWTTDPFLRSVAEEGAGVVGGQSIAARELTNLLEDIKRFPFLGAIPERTPAVGKVIKLLNNVTEYINSGLFDGVYLAQAKHFAKDWGEHLRRSHPTWTEQQIAAATADNISLALSSQARWQSIFRNRGTQQFMRALLFSFAESEGLMRGFVRMLPGSQPEARTLWRKYWVGYYVSSFIAAEAINYAATGEFLGPEQLSPVRFDDTGRPRYNWKFMRPIMDRLLDETPVYLDLLGQLDTPLRWAIDPPQALQNRLSVPVRQALDQIKNAEFSGKRIATEDTFLERLGQRALYAVREVGTPITPGQILREPELPLKSQVLQGLGFGVVAPKKPETPQERRMRQFQERLENLEQRMQQRQEKLRQRLEAVPAGAK